MHCSLVTSVVFDGAQLAVEYFVTGLTPQTDYIESKHFLMPQAQMLSSLKVEGGYVEPVVALPTHLCIKIRATSS